MNVFERNARAAKVAALLRHVPAGNGAAQAARLAAFTPQMRAIWAAGCGVNVPSEASWRDLIAALRARTEAA